MAEAPKTVKCAECGFAALYHRREGTFGEMDAHFRERGLTEAGSDTKLWPWCFVRAWPIHQEIVEQMGISTSVWFAGRTDPASVVAVLHNARECPRTPGDDGYTPWQPGFSPKEHREMLDRHLMLDFQTRREDADRAWRDEQRRKDEEWRAEQRHLDQQWQTRQLRWQRRQAAAERDRHRATIIITGIGATLALVVATIVGAYIQRGYGPTERPSPAAPIVVPAPQVVVNNVLPTAAPPSPAPAQNPG